MDTNLSAIIDNFHTCVICMRDEQEVQIVNSLSDKITNIYKLLVQEGIKKLGPTTIKLCDVCVKNLNFISEFRQQCLNSIEKLGESAVFLVKKEIMDHDEDLPVQIKAEQILIETPSELVLNYTEDTLKKDVTSKKVGNKKMQQITKKMKDEKKSERIKCELCDDTFNNKTNLKYHIIGEHENGYKCKHCTMAFEDKEKYEEHKRKEETRVRITCAKTGLRGDELSYCPICHENFTRGMEKHIEIHYYSDKDNDIICIVCDKTFVDINSFFAHLSSHREFDEIRKCHECDETFKSRKEYKAHVTVHKEKLDGKIYKEIYACDFCSCVHTRRSHFKNHILAKHKGAMHCKYCGRTFLDKEKYEEHMEQEAVNRSNQTYCCEHCGFETKWKSFLGSHIQKAHTPDRPEIICNECGKTFKTKSQFKLHQLSVHLPKQCQCNICGKSFVYPSTLKKHHRGTHLGISRYTISKCKICGKEMKSGSIRQHIDAVHKNNRKYMCQICNMTFTSSAVLKKHGYSHTKTRPYNCNMCGTGYYQNAYLRSHFERVHGKIYDAAEIRAICGMKKIIREKN